MEEDIKEYTEHFFQDRRYILKDIEQLLNQVLQFLNQTYSKSGNDRRLTNLDLLFKSLCFVHGFYLYPANGDRETGFNINVKKDAVQDIVTNQFGTVYPHVHKPEFWEGIYTYTTFEELPREPAHLFLEMVREVVKRPQFACQIAKIYLEKLPNENRLKPVVWAQVKDDPSLCGVSLGVRHNIRPIFLCVKLFKLKTIVENNVRLSETVALKRTQRDHYGAHAKKYHIKKNPCPSCCIFFDKLLNFCNKTPSSLPPFGNCAEYDIIHTSSLNSILNNFETDWKKFYSACEFVFREFLKLINDRIDTEMVQKYVRNMKENSRFLQFKRQYRLESYELKVDDWWKFKKVNL